MKPKVLEYLTKHREKHGKVKPNKLGRTIENVNKMLSKKAATEKNG